MEFLNHLLWVDLSKNILVVVSKASPWVSNEYPHKMEIIKIISSINSVFLRQRLTDW